VRQVSRRSGEFVHWSQDARALHWAHGATLYTRELKDAFAFLDGAPQELPGAVEEGIDLAFSVPADRPAGRIALSGARVVTMRDAEPSRTVSCSCRAIASRPSARSTRSRSRRTR
jgi:hypothetical protein